MQKSSLGVIGVMIISIMTSGCATSKNMADLSKENILAAPGNKVFVAYYPADCPDEKSGITCLVEKEGTEEGMLAYAKENNTAVLVVEQHKTSSGALSSAAWTITRIGAAAVGGSAGQGFATGTRGASGSSSTSTEFTVVVNGSLSKVDCDDMSIDECRTNLQKLMMGQKIALKSKGHSMADQDMAEYMKRGSK